MGHVGDWVGAIGLKEWLVVLGFIGPPILAFVVLPFVRHYRAHKLAREALASVERTTGADGIQREGDGFWLKQPVVRPPNRNNGFQQSIPVVTVATLKGGVGKTTLSGSLAAYFAMNWTKEGHSLRVLLIDLDFQGSLSSMTVAGRRFTPPSKANLLVSGELLDGRLVGAVVPISTPNIFAPLSISTLSSYYDLAQAENRAMIEWLLPVNAPGLFGRLWRRFKAGLSGEKLKTDTSARDIRFILSQTLQNPRVQAEFDLVLIDAPPRLTTSHIQALCASTHVLIPTILDGLSSDAVARYLDQLATLKLGPLGNDRLRLCPQIEPLGVVCTMVRPAPFDPTEDLNALQASIDAARLPTDVLRDCLIKRRSPYSDCAGVCIAYVKETRAADYENLREEVDKLGATLADRLCATGRRWIHAPRENP